METTRLASSIFLLPNGTFFVELIIFLIVLVVLWRFVIPPVQKAMADRQEMVRRQAEESRLATEKFAEAQQQHQAVLAEARAESAKLRDTARAEGQQIVDELRRQASDEVDQIIRRGAEQLAAQRDQVKAELRGYAGELAVSVAGRVLGTEIPRQAGQTAVLDRLLDEAERGDREGA
ncbi:MAG: F0F1 ATP synthase subunit B [Kutzneria sp.]|nr:F0F1 ATP synthase subunit B [Kutzneria sp.]MBV9847510.1 F0F1 ATP synthase subunit B [Kutzneria sp.]